MKFGRDLCGGVGPHLRGDDVTDNLVKNGVIWVEVLADDPWADDHALVRLRNGRGGVEEAWRGYGGGLWRGG